MPPRRSRAALRRPARRPIRVRRMRLPLVARTVVPGLVVPVLVACAGSDPKGAAPPPAAPGASRDSAAALPAEARVPAATVADTGLILRGMVREQLAVGPYIYLRLETAGGEEWAAVAAAPVETGQQVTVYNAMLMTGFASKTLERRFDRIHFGSLTPPGQTPPPAPAPAGAMPAGAAGGPPSGETGTPPVVDARIGPIARATGDGARTVAELWAEKGRAAGWTVTVRGVVVRYNAGVMGKNWLHLQDGTGDVRAGTRELTVTSSATAAVGDTVTITGRVATNKDFGAGYRYALLVENATLR